MELVTFKATILEALIFFSLEAAFYRVEIEISSKTDSRQHMKLNIEIQIIEQSLCDNQTSAISEKLDIAMLLNLLL